MAVQVNLLIICATRFIEAESGVEIPREVARETGAPVFVIMDPT